MSKKAGLSPKQRAFVEAYLKCWNASEAARQAGYKGQANVVGPRLLANVSIVAAIEARFAELEMGSKEVLIGFAKQARFDMLEFTTVEKTNAGEQVANIDLMAIKAAGLGFLVKEISYDRYGRMVVKFDSSHEARKLIGQHKKLFGQREEAKTDEALEADWWAAVDDDPA